MKILNKKINFLLISLLISIISISILSVRYFNTAIKIDRETVKLDAGFLYYSLQHESDPLKSDPAELQSLCDSLSNTNLYTYYELYAQPLDFPQSSIGYFSPNATDLSYEAGRASCLQISENVQQDFTFTPIVGRLFQKDDFLYHEDQPIPMVMGYAYSKLYQLGDILTCEYLFDPYKFEVVGFLEQGNAITASVKNMTLDHTLLIPSFSIAEDVSITDGLKIHYANKTSGKIKVSEENSNSAFDYFFPLISHNPDNPYSWTHSSVSKGFQEEVGISLRATFILFIGLSILLSAVLFGVTVLYFRNAVPFKNRLHLAGHLVGILCISSVFSGILSLLLQAALKIPLSFFILKGIPIIMTVYIIFVIAFFIMRSKKRLYE